MHAHLCMHALTGVCHDQLEELAEVWPDDVTSLAAVLTQRDPIVRHIAATVLAVAADHDAHVRSELCKV